MDYIVWNPRRGDSGEERYFLPPTNPEYHPDIPLDELHQIPMMAGELPPEISQQTGPRFWDDPVTGYTIDQVNECTDWNQIMAEYKRRLKNLDLSSENTMGYFETFMPFARSTASGMMMQEEMGMPVGMFPYNVSAYYMDNARYVHHAWYTNDYGVIRKLLYFEQLPGFGYSPDPGGEVSGFVSGLTGRPMQGDVLWSMRRRLSVINRHTLAMRFMPPNDKTWTKKYVWNGSAWAVDSEVMQNGSPWHSTFWGRTGVDRRIPTGSPPNADPAVLYRMRQLCSVALPAPLVYDIPHVAVITAVWIKFWYNSTPEDPSGTFAYAIDSRYPKIRLYMSDSDDSDPQIGDQNNTDHLLIPQLGSPFEPTIYVLDAAAKTAFKNRFAQMLKDPTQKMSFVVTTREEEELEDYGFPSNPDASSPSIQIDNYVLNRMDPSSSGTLYGAVYIFTANGDPAP